MCITIGNRHSTWNNTVGFLCITESTLGRLLAVINQTVFQINQKALSCGAMEGMHYEAVKQVSNDCVKSEFRSLSQLLIFMINLI